MSKGQATPDQGYLFPEAFSTAIIEAVRRQETAYTSCIGDEEARAAVAAWQTTESTKYEADDVILTSGVSQCLHLVAASVL